MEILIKTDDLGVPLFLETPKSHISSFWKPLWHSSRTAWFINIPEIVAQLMEIELKFRTAVFLLV